MAAAKRKTDDLDVAAELDQADRSRHVRSGARGEGHRVTGPTSRPVKGPTVTVTKRRNEGVIKPKGDSPERAPQGEVKPRPRKKKR